MSYEGYTQLLCANGHPCNIDAYDSEPPTCMCGALWLDRNQVDQTNGCDGDPCQCGARELVELTAPVFAKCNLDHSHVITQGTYRFGKVVRHALAVAEAIGAKEADWVTRKLTNPAIREAYVKECVELAVAEERARVLRLVAGLSEALPSYYAQLQVIRDLRAAIESGRTVGGREGRAGATRS